MRIKVALPLDSRRVSDIDRWVYLGKDIQRRASVAAVLGEKNRILVGNRLHRMLREIRSDIINWVGEVGANEPNPILWWATRLSSKSPLQTDFFLLAAMAALFEDILSNQAEIRQKACAIIIEDPWLYSLLQAHYAEDERLHFISLSTLVLLRERLRNMARGILARLNLFGKALRQIVILHWRLRRSNQSATTNDVAWIYSPAEPQFLCSDGSVDDQYMTGLGRLLEERGIKVRRLVGLLLSRDIEDRLLIHGDDVLFLMEGITLRVLLGALTSFWRPHKHPTAALRGLRLDLLLQREMWLEIGSANLSLNILYYQSFRWFLETHPGRSLFFFFEGQPWEKMIRLARDHAQVGIALIGYQHSTIPFLLLNYFPAAREWHRLPFPDRVLANGPFHKAVLDKAGYPPGLVEDAGALRYPAFNKNHRELGAGPKKVYAALPFDPCIAREMLDLLIENVPTWIEHDIEFLIKIHPDSRLQYISRRLEEGGNLFQTTGSLLEHLDRIDAVLYSSTTLGLEALFSGVPTLAYVPEMVVSLDFTLDWFPEQVVVCDRTNLAERLLMLLESPPSKAAAIAPELIFGPVREDVWIASALGKLGRA